MISINEYVLIAVGIVWIIGVALIYFECNRVYIDVQDFIDDIESEDRDDEYMYKQLMKEVDYDK